MIFLAFMAVMILALATVSLAFIAEAVRDIANELRRRK